MQNEHNIEMQEELSEIQTEQQIEVAKAQQEVQEESEDEQKAKQSKKRKFSVATGRGAGRPNLSGRVYTENRNWEGRSNWDSWNAKT